MPIAALVPDLVLSMDDGDAILELAFLMSATDGYLADEELAAFRELVGLVRRRAVTPKEIDDLLGRFLMEASQEGVDERVRYVATIVPESLRETAYRVAVGVAVADHDEGEHEAELAGELALAFGISRARATALTKEARAALRAPTA